MGKAEWKPQAESELEDIVFYVAKVAGRPQAAVRVMNEILEKMALYADNPEMGQRRLELPPE